HALPRRRAVRIEQRDVRVIKLETIAERRGKVARAFRRRQDERGCRVEAALAAAFIVEKEEGPVGAVIAERPEDFFRESQGAAEVPAELIEAQLAATGLAILVERGDRVARLQPVVAEELKQRAVKLRAARFGRHVDLADALELGGVGVVLQLELLNRIER